MLIHTRQHPHGALATVTPLRNSTTVTWASVTGPCTTACSQAQSSNKARISTDLCIQALPGNDKAAILTLSRQLVRKELSVAGG
jgi:hypothetical protein